MKLTLGELDTALVLLVGVDDSVLKGIVGLKDRELPVTMHPIEAKNGNEIAHVNPETFDKAFAKTKWQYVGKKGEGGIEGRYEKFAEWVKDAKSMHASNVSVNKDALAELNSEAKSSIAFFAQVGF